MLSVEDEFHDFLLSEDFLNDDLDFENLFESLIDEQAPNEMAPAPSTSTGTSKRKHEVKVNIPMVEQPVPVMSLDKSDVRSSYPKRVETAVNSHEKKGVQEILSKFCTQDLKTIYYYPKGNPHGVSYRELNGIKVSSDYIAANFSSAPDSLFLIHSSQYIQKDDGSMTILCKFTCNGSKLYTVTAENNCGIVSNPPALKRLYASMEKVREKYSQKQSNKATKMSRTDTAHTHNNNNNMNNAINYSGNNNNNSTTNNSNGLNTTQVAPNTFLVKTDPMAQSSTDCNNAQDELRAQDFTKCDSVRPHISLKGEVNKFDRYKHQKSDTLGSFVQYTAFSESSLQPKVHDEDYCDPASSQATIQGCYRNDEIMIAGDETKFGHSALLPVPISFEIYGVLKIFVNADKRVSRMDALTASKNIKIPK